MNESMNVVAVTGKNQVTVLTAPIPAPGPGEVLVKIKACALCTWEQRVFIGEKDVPYPLVGGHEAAGEIAAVGAGLDETDYPAGARVAVRVVKCCNRCYYCRRGEHHLCEQLNTFRLNGPELYGMGGLAEYIAVPAHAVWVYDSVPLPFPVLALTEPLACVLHSIERAQIGFGDDVVVIGGGIMGVLHVLCAKRRGARVILSEPDKARRDFALSLGCDIALDPSGEDAVQAVLELTRGRGAEVVFNTTAISSVAEQALKMTAKMGRCVMFSSQHPDKPIAVSPNWLHNTEAIITGAVNPGVRSFDMAVNAISKGILDLSPLVTGAFPYTSAEEAFLCAVRPDTYRVVVTF